MKVMCIAVLATAIAATPSSAQQDDKFLARAKAVLKSSPLVDGHNDLPWRIREDTLHANDIEAYDLAKRTPGMTDLARLKAGLVGAQFWSVYIPGEPNDGSYARNGNVSSTPGYARVQLEQIQIARRIIARYPQTFAFATTEADVRKAFASHRIGSMLGMEGGHAIENSLEVLRAYYDLGARYMTLTHNVTLDWADAALDTPKHGGLTPFGREVVREMNRLGMLCDLSHVSPGTMSNVLDVTEAPVIFSHSGARALVDHRRNVPDSILARVPRNGGVVMVPFVAAFTSKTVYADDVELERMTEDIRRRMPSDTAAQKRELAAWRKAHPRPRSTLAEVADHIDHVRKVAGVDHVGIGSDFDGIAENVIGLEDVSTFPMLFAELARRGWSDAELKKLAGENVLRVLKRAEVVSARLKRERPASIATIQQLDHTVVRP
ncbi:MAG: peptidase renal dipeptidase [Gemmatimonadetes bacterium]|nr:peptidase renal dipeptidase [Gemmatimonadota bacterium]